MNHYIVDKKITLLLIIFLLVLVKPNTNGNNNNVFLSLKVEDGLSHNNVKCVYRDHFGYLWIGTKNGLNRYDGSNIKQYYYSFYKHSLPDNSINVIIEDSLNNLWVGTRSGLALYNRDRDEFDPIILENNFNSRINTIELISGGFLLGCTNKVFVYSYNTMNFSEVSDLSDQFKHQQMTDVDVINDHLMLACGTGADIYIYNYRSNQVVDSLNSNHKGSKNIIGEKDHFWLGINDGGLFRYDYDGNLLEEFNVTNSKLTSNIVLDLLDNGDELLIATDGGGINVLNKETGTISIINHRANSVESYPSNSVNALYKDNFGNIISGTVRSGVVWHYKTYAKTFIERDDNGLNCPTILALCEDRYGDIWIGTDGGGLNKYEPDHGRIMHLSNSSDKINSLISYDNKRLLVSKYNAGLTLFNTETNSFEEIGTSSRLFKIRNESRKIITIKDSYGFIWISAKNKYRYSPENNQLEILNEENGWRIKKGRGWQYPSRLIEGENGSIIMCSDYNVYYIDAERKESYEIISSEQLVEGYKPEILSLNYDKNNKILLIGSSIGVHSYNIESGHLDYFECSYFNMVNSILKANDYYWLGTTNGLYVFNINSLNFTQLNYTDGVFCNDFFKSSIVSGLGHKYFGGVNGFVEIERDWKMPSYQEEHIWIAGVEVDGSSQVVNSEDAKLKLPYNYKTIDVDLFVKGKDLFTKRMFRYMIEGYSDKVFYTDKRRLSFLKFPPGDYQLKIWQDLKDGSWSKLHKSIKIHVEKPWWKRNWFYMLSFIIMIFFLASIYFVLHKQSKLKMLVVVEKEKRKYEEELNSKKLNFFTNISHELRTPLSIIYGSIKRIVADDNIKTSDLRAKLLNVHRHTTRMKLLVDQVIDFRRLEMVDDFLELSNFNFVEWLSNFLDMFKFETASKSVRIKLNKSNDELLVLLDKDKCEKIVSNLIVNAIKYSPLGGEIEINVHKDREYLEMSIADQGKGIVESDKELIFKDFQQGTNHLTGSGIGLAFVKSLVEKMSGTINVIDLQGKGAEFVIRLPIRLNEINIIFKTNSFDVKGSLNEGEDQNASYEIIGKGIKRKVLLVEDDQDLSNHIKDILDEFFIVSIASNGKIAIDQIFNENPDLIISDIMMPEMNGMELCKRIKEDLTISHIPIVLLTAKVDVNTQIMGYKNGADVYLSKPFDDKLLLMCIDNLLNSRDNIKKLFKSGFQWLPSEVTNSRVDEAFLLKIIAVINKLIENPNLDVQMVSTELGYSRSALYSKLHAITGSGVNSLIRKIRVDKAQELLNDVSVSIADVSDMVGFKNQAYFSKVFKEVVGITPKQYRTELKG